MSTNETHDTESLEGVAIVGMSGRFPGAPNLEVFWSQISQGVESIQFFSDEQLRAAGVDESLVTDPDYVPASPVLDGIEWFDANFFGIPPREAQLMDPQHRLFLEATWEALESAGYHPERYDGRIGIFGGASVNSYLLLHIAQNPALLYAPHFQAMILHGNMPDHLTTRVAYKLNCKGPAVTVSTACSTSLVAVHTAVQSLLNFQCDMAVAGGVSVKVPQEEGYLFTEGNIFSRDGHCRPFDASASGTVFGSGVGTVVLKRLEDALADRDTIYAVIKGSAVNNDGSQKVGYTAPSVEGQAEVIAEALAMADVEPDTVSYIEAHGTGTILGDPIEVTALTDVFQQSTARTGFCAIGSVKANVGHLNAASGITGLIKTVLALQEEQLPPQLHFTAENPNLSFADSPFFVNTELRPWRRGSEPRRAGVSSFGIGGTNAHVVLEEAPLMTSGADSRAYQLVTLSAKTPSALEAMTANLAQHLARHTDTALADAAYTLHVGRQTFAHRRLVVVPDREEAVRTLETCDPQRVLTHFQEASARGVVFLYPGQGAQYAGMAQELYAVEPLFAEQVDACCDYLGTAFGLDLREVLFATGDDDQRLRSTEMAQPALFVIEYALTQWLHSLGIAPQAMNGHSVGEYVAATVAGVMEWQDALKLLVARGKLIQGLPQGAMLSVHLSEVELQKELPEELDVAAVNAANLCVVSGEPAQVLAFQERLQTMGITNQLLHTSHAFHSRMMEPILSEFAALVKQVRLQAPQLPYLSNVTGTWITAEQAIDPQYWVQHLRSTVRFAEGVQRLQEHEADVWLEVGPGRTLSTLVRQATLSGGARTVLTTMRHPQDKLSDLEVLLLTLGRLWMAGVEIDWERFYADEQRMRVPLPTYPFERQRYWVEAGVRQPAVENRVETLGEIASSVQLPEGAAGGVGSHPRPNLPTPLVLPESELEVTIAEIWRELLGIEAVGIYDSFFELGGHSLMATQLASRLRDLFPIEIPVAELYEDPTIAKLADVIEELLIEHIEGLSEEELEGLM